MHQMIDAKPISVLMGAHFRLKSVVNELTIVEFDFMKRIPYSNVVGSLMYV